MRVAVTNDDGPMSGHMYALCRALSEFGYVVHALTPATEQSGVSGSLNGPISSTIVHHLTATRYETTLPDSGVEGWYVDAPPALCAVIAASGVLFPRPNVVVSGVNPGANLGGNIWHSGTVGGAIAASNLGIPGIAVSLQEPATFMAEAGATAACLVEAVTRNGCSGAWNLNVPDLPLHEILGASLTVLHDGSGIQSSTVDRQDGERGIALRVTYSGPESPLWSTAEDDDDRFAKTDVSSLRAGAVSVTPLDLTMGNEGTDHRKRRTEVFRHFVRLYEDIRRGK